MRKGRRFRPAVDSLEDRLALSSGVADVVRPGDHQGQFGDLGTAAANASATTISLAGMARGTYTSRQNAADTGTTFAGSAKGKVTPLGQVTVTGSFHTPGLIKNGKIQGSLTLHGQRGTLTLSAAGPAAGQSSSRTFRLTYTITAGTGLFHNAKGTGVVVITVTPAPTSGAGFPRLGHGKVSLTFSAH